MSEFMESIYFFAMVGACVWAGYLLGKLLILFLAAWMAA
jgi:hypothetical protein